ncbi:hypothetical protein [Actinoplanes cyaneus]|nr:hypothetical protein [Actinoplanes cyaneus]
MGEAAAREGERAAAGTGRGVAERDGRNRVWVAGLWTGLLL